eukprot:Nitzschia sp. Nitz4//scaffold8_size234185//108470//110063//NITZ4_001260-RA/size234185-snap-gene-0.43-mRNA-1//-1//CDS//3329559815//7318//frame0
MVVEAASHLVMSGRAAAERREERISSTVNQVKNSAKGGQGLDNDMEGFGSQLNTGDNVPGDMMERLTISESLEANLGLASSGTGLGMNNGGASHNAGDHIGPSESLEVQLPNPRGAGDESNLGNPSMGSYGIPAPSAARRSEGAGTSASQALHALQASAEAAAVPSRGRGSSSAPPEDKAKEEEEVEEDENSTDMSASDGDSSWIAWFCSLRGNEFFCEVEEDYIQDDFNLTGLQSIVPYYNYALDMVLDVEIPLEHTLTREQQEILESAAEMLYGMIHARYIVTNRGMNAMFDKYRLAAFGRCPQVFCQGQPVLPVGLSDMPRNYTVNVFCPRCYGLFYPKSTRQANIDGAYFGTTFPHLYLMTHPDLIPSRPTQTYVPRVYGFRVHESSLFYLNHEGVVQSQQQQRRSQSDSRQLRRPNPR